MFFGGGGNGALQHGYFPLSLPTLPPLAHPFFAHLPRNPNSQVSKTESPFKPPIPPAKAERGHATARPLATPCKTERGHATESPTSNRAGTCHRTTSCYTMHNRAGTCHRAADRPQTERGHKPGLHLKQLRRSPTPLPGTKQCGAALRYDAPGVCMPPRAPWCARPPFITPDIPTHTRLETEGTMPNTKRSPCKTFSATDAVGGGWQHAMPSTIDLQAWVRKSNGIPD